MERDEGGVTGVWTRGTHPQELVLSDGSRLLLESSVGGDGEVAWRRTDGRDTTEGSVSVPEALDLAGEVYSDYVAVRTRAEAAWLRAVAEWCHTEATRLEQDLVAAS